MGKRGTPAERLNRRLVRMPNGCLEWTGYTDQGDYGQINVDGKPMLTHRLAWELTHGPIPPGVAILHHCDNPPCCDALDTEHHLFLGTRGDNAADRDTKGRTNNGQAAKTECPQGHPYFGANLYVKPNGNRVCRTCQKNRLRRRYAPSL